MKNFAFSVAVKRVLAVCLTLSFLEFVAGCGFSYNSAAEKDLKSYSTPVISCSANPSSVTSGSNALIAARAVSPIDLPLTYSFSTSGGTITSQGSSATLQTQTAAGNVAVTCQVVDTKGNASSTTTMVIVQPNESAPPTINCSANPSATMVGGTIVITSVGSSPEGRPLAYSWSSSSGSISGNGNIANLNTGGAAPGAITVSCKVADSQGLTASTTTSVTVTAPPSAPPMISCSANPSTVTSGGSVALTAIASSPEGRPLTYSWSTSSGSISGSGNTATLNTNGAIAGKVTVTCKVADDQGRTASTTIGVTVTSASAPGAVSCSANPSVVAQGQTTTITASENGAQNQPLTYSYSVSAGSISETDATATLETYGVSAGIITVTCAVEKQGGGPASATTNVLVQSVTGEQAVTNYQFTDSVGVNVHLGYSGTVYTTQFPQIMNAMIDLGVKHYRDGLTPLAPAVQYENAEMLGKAGLKADWLMDINSSAAVINSAYTNAPDATAAFEGPNEIDADVGPQVLNFMQLLNDTVRSTPATATMPIIAPSFITASSFATQGNLNSLINFGNMHDYFGNRNPETGPYGGTFYNCVGYGTMQFAICLAQLVGVNEQVISTETGYESGLGLSDEIIGRYEARTLFESLNLGVNRTYLYSLIDYDTDHYGLLTESFSPKPAYTAIQNILSLLKDVNYAQPGKLDYTLAGQTQNVYHSLLEKSDGTFYLAVWVGVQGADPNNPSTVYTIAPQNVTLSANTPIGGATTYILDDLGNMTSAPAELTNGSLNISVTDRVTLIALLPGQSH
jgi:hypothetical protein